MQPDPGKWIQDMRDENFLLKQDKEKLERENADLRQQLAAVKADGDRWMNDFLEARGDIVDVCDAVGLVKPTPEKPWWRIACETITEQAQQLAAERQRADEAEADCASMRDDLLKYFKEVADSAYVQGSQMLNKDECRGADHKMEQGKFTRVNLQAFCDAERRFGLHFLLHKAIKEMPDFLMKPNPGQPLLDRLKALEANRVRPNT